MIQRTIHIPDGDVGRIVERPDGYYWIDPESGIEIGPYPTAADARADMESGGESDFEPGETVEEAETEIGIADWIDPETGEPAENSRPHIEE